MRFLLTLAQKATTTCGATGGCLGGAGVLLALALGLVVSSRGVKGAGHGGEGRGGARGITPEAAALEAARQRSGRENGCYPDS